MKKTFTVFLAMSIVTAFSACNTATDAAKEAGKEKIHNELDSDNQHKDDGHQHDSTPQKDADTLGMKMGGNELDLKKK